MTPRVKIRGIYATALTALFLDHGFAVVAPSPKAQERFGLPRGTEGHDVFIRDRDDAQGVTMEGEADMLTDAALLLQRRFLDAVIGHCEPVEELEGLSRATVEFPGAAKGALDDIRGSVAPTLRRHHRLRILDADGLRQAEMRLLRYPEEAEALAQGLFRESCLIPLEKAGTGRIELVRVFGKAVAPREGVVIEATERRVLLRRTFSGGRYDGLDLPIEEGDYALTELIEGAWHVRHAYHDHAGKLRGEYVNVNTPIEIYPFGARYVGLEVAVCRRAGKEPSLVDVERLAALGKGGFIGAALEKKAKEIAEDVRARIFAAPLQP